jgi:hypothetical protein
MSVNGLPAVWLQGCRTPEEKEARKLMLYGSRSSLLLLLKILGDRYDTIEKKGLREEDYADTGWITLQAFRNGRIAELTELADLLNFIKE